MDTTNKLAPFGAVPTHRQLEHLEMAKKAFFHFGVNTFSDTEWGNGEEKEKIFDPSEADVRQWVKTARDAGFKLAIITAKHHDGFCLWPSAYTKHTIANSPYKDGKGDIVREFTDACREFGLKAGIYLSPWDRHCEFWGTPEYSNFYKNQLIELMTNYGRIDEVWWDGAGSVNTKYEWGEWAEVVHKYQPNAVMFGSFGATPYVEMRWVGNEAGFAGETHYSSIDNESMYKEVADVMNVGVYGAERFIVSEVDVSIRPGWFYHKEQDDTVKSVEELNNLWFRSVGRNSIMLLNFPPDKRGLVCDIDINNAVTSAKQINDMLAVNFLEGAAVTSDSTYENYVITNAVSENGFYVSEDLTAHIEMDLGAPTELNVLTLGEELTLGERITSFTLESIDDSEPKVLYSGTSVGYMRAVLFEKKAYRRLRLTVTGADAVPTLRTLALRLFRGSTVNPAHARTVNLMENKAAKIEFSEDKKSVTLSFGGVYPFRNIYFRTNGIALFTVYYFDGSKFQWLGRDYARSSDAEFHLKEFKEGCYQIRIEIESGAFEEGTSFYVG